jgi:hypothetical protein
MARKHVLTFTTHAAETPFGFVDPITMGSEWSDFLARLDRDFRKYTKAEVRCQRVGRSSRRRSYIER